MFLKYFTCFLHFFRDLFNFFSKHLAHARHHETTDKYLELAEHGDPEAQFQLALFYLKEEIEPKNWPEIIKWLSSAANSGHREAQIKIGCLLRYGYGFSFNLAAATIWFQTAADNGHEEALIHLAAMENDGLYIPKDPKPLHEALLSAAPLGNPLAQYNLALRLDKGPKEDQESAKDWYWKAIEGFLKLAENGDVRAQYHLGIIFQEGKGVPCNPKISLNWFQEAGKKGLSLAQFSAGKILLNGEGVPKNSTLGISWISKAATQGLIAASLKMDELTAQGAANIVDLPKNPANSSKWFADAKNKGLAELLEEL
ncbi:MAG: sel1 repeat family protein, partial [Deltaproteobacteria bacterium]|nr:sel1 repeat family protein [Deltaproteobacteria bacterium]